MIHFTDIERFNCCLICSTVDFKSVRIGFKFWCLISTLKGCFANEYRSIAFRGMLASFACFAYYAHIGRPSTTYTYVHVILGSFISNLVLVGLFEIFLVFFISFVCVATTARHHCAQ
jgi:hypothetical protein